MGTLFGLSAHPLWAHRTVVAIAVAAGALVQTIRIGHSGAQATWSTPGVSTPGPSEQGER